MTRAELIRLRLQEAFNPTLLEVADDSHRHAGHSGSRPGGETHFSVYIVSGAFAGKGRVERHRMINAILADELAPERIHALAITARSPDEPARPAGVMSPSDT